MNFKIKGTTLIMSEAPVRYIARAILVKRKDQEMEELDVIRGQKEYPLPDKLTHKDISAVYIRVL